MQKPSLSSGAVSGRVRAWTDQIRTQGFETLWNRLADSEREEFFVFASELEKGFKLEDDQQWQASADLYKTLSERFPAYSDISISRASFVISDKVNRAIRYYNQGVQAIESKMYQKAVQFFGLALMVDRNMEKAVYNLAMAHKLIFISDPEKMREHKIHAIDNFMKLLEINRNHAKARAQIDYLRSI